MIVFMAQWLVKEEPDHYGATTSWRKTARRCGLASGIHSRKNTCARFAADRIFYYHTGKEKAVVATAKAASDATRIRPTRPESLSSSMSFPTSG